MSDTDERIEKIRTLLSEVEGELRTPDDRAFVRNFDALDIPELVSEVVRFLQPLLTPYEAAVYWHMFELAVLRSGDQYCRVSTRGLMNGVVRSASGQGDALSIQTTRGALQGLEERGAIQRVGEPTRDGTPYRVLLPEEIPACRELMKPASPAPATSVDVARDLDYYNLRENRLKVFERDGYLCKYCSKQLTRFTATLDHVQPVSEGGDNSIENLVTACLHCNSRRGSRPVMDIINEAEKRDYHSLLGDSYGHCIREL
jgi:hypothetical protein